MSAIPTRIEKETQKLHAESPPGVKALFEKREGEKVYTCVFPVRGRQVLLGMKKRGFGAGMYNGFGGKVRVEERVEDCARRELEEECGLWGALRPCAEVVVLFDCAKRTRHHIFTAEALSGEPIETDEMAPKWFDVEAMPYEQMWPDIRMWLPQALWSNGGLLVRGYFEVVEGRLTESQPLAPIPAAVDAELSAAIAADGAAFSCGLSGCKQEFDCAWNWAWAVLGAHGQHRVTHTRKRSVSTADTPNRLRDKQRVEGAWGLHEFGDAHVELRDRTGKVVALGYVAITGPTWSSLKLRFAGRPFRGTC